MRERGQREREMGRVRRRGGASRERQVTRNCLAGSHLHPPARFLVQSSLPTATYCNTTLSQATINFSLPRPHTHTHTHTGQRASERERQRQRQREVLLSDLTQAKAVWEQN